MAKKRQFLKIWKKQKKKKKKTPKIMPKKLWRKKGLFLKKNTRIENGYFQILEKKPKKTSIAWKREKRQKLRRQYL